VAGGDFRLSPWETSTALGKKYGIPVYCDLDPSIPYSLRSPYNRNSIETYRGRAMNAWDAGAAGIYIFNVFNPRHPLWRELGDPMALRRMDKFYFVNVTGESGYLHASRALPGGRQHLRMPILHPRSPMRLVAAESVDVSLRVGEDLAAADPAPSVTCHLLAAVDQPPQVTLNGTRLQGDKQDGGWFDYPVRPVCVKRGDNRFVVVMADGERGGSEWDVEQVCNTRPPAPWSTGRKRPGTEVALKDDALLIADRSSERSSYCYHMYPWHVDPATLAVAEARTRVLSGRSTLIVTNGVAEEEVRLHTDRIVAQHAGLSHPFDTTDAFHVYRVEIEGKDIRVLVDGKLAIDGAGKFTYPAHSSRNVIAFGASSSGTTGEALWQSVRFRSGSRALFDLLLAVDYSEL